MKLKERKLLREFAKDKFYEDILDDLENLNLNIYKTTVINHINRIFTFCKTDKQYIISNIIEYINNPKAACKSTKESYILKYGPEEGIKRFELYVNLISNIHKQQYKNGRKVVFVRTKDDYINLGYDEITAEQKVMTRKNNAAKASALSQKDATDMKPTQLGYWIKKGYSEEEAKIKLSERQTTFSLEKCISKHGEIEGRIIWKNRQDSWLRTLNLKSDEEKLLINKKKASYIRPKYDSCKETKILNYLENEFNISIKRQHVLFLENVNSHRSFDGIYKNILIEFNGDYWHCNPKKYNGDYYNEVVGKTAFQIWEYDNQKILGARELGYLVFTIWESEFDNKESIKERFKNVIG